MKVGDIVKMSDGLNASYYTITEVGAKTATAIWAVVSCDEDLKVTWTMPNDRAMFKIRLATMTAPGKMKCHPLTPEQLDAVIQAAKKRKLCHLVRTLDFESLSVTELSRLYQELRKR